MHIWIDMHYTCMDTYVLYMYLCPGWGMEELWMCACLMYIHVRVYIHIYMYIYAYTYRHTRIEYMYAGYVGLLTKGDTNAGNYCFMYTLTVRKRGEHTATRWNTLQHTATYCNTLQHSDSCMYAPVWCCAWSANTWLEMWSSFSSFPPFYQFLTATRSTAE